MGMVVAEGLHKRFGDTVALRGVDLDVGQGTVLGLLGPNGAGKTTIVRILSTLLKPDSGRAVIDGLDVVAEPRAVRTRIGLTGQFAALDERLTPRENLIHVGRLLHLPASEVRHRTDVLIRRLDIEAVAERPVQHLSGGTRRRLDIAMSLVGDPPVLFLDEPTTGLDPRSRQAVWSLVSELASYGTTVVLTTQYLDEADQLAQEIAVVDGGTVIARGTPGELKRRVGGDRVLVDLRRPSDSTRARAALADLAVGRIRAAENTLAVPVSAIAGMVPQIVRLLDGAGVEVGDVTARRSTLDDVFFALTGRATATDDDPDAKVTAK